MSEFMPEDNEEPVYGLYTHEIEETGQIIESPFPVIVLGENGENLGVGMLVGGINYDFDNNYSEAVIVIDDPIDPTGKVTMSEQDCFWEYLDPNDAELMNNVAATNLDYIVSARLYLDKQDAKSYRRDFCLTHTGLYSGETPS
jgi:hypothetical protein